MSHKPDGAAPEIPAAIQARASKTYRPRGFAPIAGEQEITDKKGEPMLGEDLADTFHAEGDVKNLKPFLKKLAVAIKKPQFVTEEHEKIVRRRGEYVKEIRQVKSPVKVVIGEDGLPYPPNGTTKEQFAKARGETYPDAPKQRTDLGDLSPEFVEWLYLNHPYDAALRYYGRHTHVQTFVGA